MADKKEKVIVAESDIGDLEDVLGPIEPLAEVAKVEVTLNLGQAEFVGQHIIFIGGKSVVFHDGIANVKPDQVELLQKYGYIK